MERHRIRSIRRLGYRLLVILAVAPASCSMTPAMPFQVKVPSSVLPRSAPPAVARAVGQHIGSHPDVYPPGTTHRIISMEWLPPTEEFTTPDGGGFGFKKPAWAVTIDGPVRGPPGEPPPGPLNVIMVDDATAQVWGWTP